MAKHMRLLLRHQDDRRLVELVAAGHDGAFEVIVERYRRSLLARCRRLVGADWSEDVLQQALLNAHRALRRGDDVAELGPWLHRVASNAAISALRSSGAADEPIEAAMREGVAVESAEAAVERRERLRDVVGSVGKLPRRQREALVLQVGEGRSYDEIADRLALSDGAVRQLLNRARRSLRAGVTAITPFGLLLRWGAVDAQAAGGTAMAAGGAGVIAKGGAVAATVLAVGGVAAITSSELGQKPASRAVPAAQSQPLGGIPPQRSGSEGAPPELRQPDEQRAGRRVGGRARRAETPVESAAGPGKGSPAGGRGRGRGPAASGPAGDHDSPTRSVDARPADEPELEAAELPSREAPERDVVGTLDVEPPEREDVDTDEAEEIELEPVDTDDSDERDDEEGASASDVQEME